QQVLVAHRLHERGAQRRDPLRRHAGRHHVRAAEGLGAVDQSHHRRFSGVVAKSTASGTPILLMSGWPWTSTRMKPDWSQSGRCALRLDQLKPHSPLTSSFSMASVISRVPGEPLTRRILVLVKLLSIAG